MDRMDAGIHLNELSTTRNSIQGKMKLIAIPVRISVRFITLFEWFFCTHLRDPRRHYKCST